MWSKDQLQPFKQCWHRPNGFPKDSTYSKVGYPHWALTTTSKVGFATNPIHRAAIVKKKQDINTMLRDIFFSLSV